MRGEFLGRCLALLAAIVWLIQPVQAQSFLEGDVIRVPGA